MWEPRVIVADSFQTAWMEAIRSLQQSAWEARNLVVQIHNVQALDMHVHEEVSAFAKFNGLLTPKHVAYTIFPYGLYRRCGCAQQLFHEYCRPGGFYGRVKTGWGTYFHRMTCYRGRRGDENQLGRIIQAINSGDSTYKAAYTMVIQMPGGETVRRRGGPCLNYIAVQLQPGHPRILGLLCVYRNHDFRERAYGNYWGLCNLLSFLAQETGSNPGPLTCISSRAYVPGRKANLVSLLERIE